MKSEPDPTIPPRCTFTTGRGHRCRMLALSGTSYCFPHQPKPEPDPVMRRRRWGRRHLDQVQKNKSGRRDADRRVFLPSASFGMRSRAERSALACRRPTTALAAANERHRSAPERSSWDAAKKRALPAPACPSPATWPQTGRSAGRTFSRSRPRAQVTNLHPQEPLPLRQPA